MHLAVFLILMCLFPSITKAGTAPNPLQTKAPTSLQFNNFSHAISINKAGDIYRLPHNGLYVQLFPALIVKVSHQTPVHLVKEIDVRIKNVLPLFSAPEYSYYHVLLKDFNDLPFALKRLQAHTLIVSVQPDMLQLGFTLPTMHNAPPIKKSPAKTRQKQRQVTLKVDRNNHAQSIDQRYLTYLKRIGVPALWQKTQGLGIKIAVIDDGFQLHHPALKNITPSFSYDLHTQQLSLESRPRNAIHGTKIAGVIWASHNPADYSSSSPAPVSGIAPLAGFIALRHSDTRTSKMLLALQLANLAGADIINCSWNSHWLLEPIADAINTLSLHGRQGKGTAVIIAAGNESQLIAPHTTEASLNSPLVVAASDEHLKRLAISNYGASVDLLVYGAPIRTPSTHEGYVLFSGTSSATAITSGFAALILSQQPNLTLAQLEHQLKALTTASAIHIQP